MRAIQAAISSSALQHNLHIVRQHAKTAKIMAVVKANAYGHGLITAAHALHAADGFATLNLSEAIDLREAGIEQAILLLEGVLTPAALRIAASFNIGVVVHNVLQIQLLENTPLTSPIAIHLKMNTGMNRLGFAPTEYQAAYQRLQHCAQVAHITLMTHFATADSEEGIAKPLACFTAATKTLDAPATLANSAAILRYPQAHADWVRPGIMLYGATPVAGTAATDFNLKPAMQLTTQIIATRTIAKGDSVGYGTHFIASKPMRIGIVACGYADGYPRHAPNGTPLAVNGCLTQTLGRVSMDMLCCDLTDLPAVDIGASVELWGATISVDSVAAASGTVGYELLCAVAPRVTLKLSD